MLEATRYIKRLIDTDSSNEKKAIIREAAVEGCVELFEGFQLAYNKRRVYDVKKAPVIEGDFTEAELEEESDTFNWPEFLAMLHKVEAKKITGKVMNEVFHLAAQVACIDDWNLFYRPILLKDLRCGVRETTVNKVLREMGSDALKYLTPVWGVQEADEAGKHPRRVEGINAVDPLLNGTRLLTVLDVDIGLVRTFTIKGKETDKFTKEINGLKSLLDILPFSLVLDGVIVDHDLYENTLSCYALFDMIPLDDFDIGSCQMTLMNRHEGLVEIQGLLQEHTGGKVYVVPKLIVDLDIEEDRNKMLEMVPCVLKNPEGSYEGGLTQDWLKMEELT